MNNEKLAEIAGLELKKDFKICRGMLKNDVYLIGDKYYCKVYDWLPRQKVEQAILVWFGFKNDFPPNYEPHILDAITSSLMTLNNPEELAEAICTVIEEAGK